LGSGATVLPIMAIGRKGASQVLQASIQRAAHRQAPPVEHAGVDPGRLDVLVAQQFLDRADVIVAFQQVGGEGVGLEARSAPSGPSRSWRSTSRYRKRRALRA